MYDLDLFENEICGIFTLLEEECRMPNPQKTSFVQKVISKHRSCSVFSLYPSGKTGCMKNAQCDFIIRHFEQDVLYTAVRNSLYSMNNEHSHF